MTTTVRWTDKDDATVWAELPPGEDPRRCSCVLAKFFHKSGEFLRCCYVPSKYILSEFTRK